MDGGSAENAGAIFCQHPALIPRHPGKRCLSGICMLYYFLRIICLGSVSPKQTSLLPGLYVPDRV
jgi:hypothetical protein